MSTFLKFVVLLFDDVFAKHIGARIVKLRDMLIVAFAVPAVLVLASIVSGLSGFEQFATACVYIAAAVNVVMLFLFFVYMVLYLHTAALMTKADVLVRFDLIPDIEKESVQAFVTVIREKIFHIQMMVFFLCALRPWTNIASWLVVLLMTLAIAVKGSGKIVPYLFTFVALHLFAWSLLRMIFPTQVDQVGERTRLAAIAVINRFSDTVVVGTDALHHSAPGDVVRSVRNAVWQDADDKASSHPLMETSSSLPVSSVKRKSVSASSRPLTAKRRLSPEKHRAVFAPLDAYTDL